MVDDIHQHVARVAWLTALFLVTLAAVATLRGWAWAPAPRRDASRDDAVERRLVGASQPAASQFATTIRRPAGAPTIVLKEVDPQGRPSRVACSTCHGVRQPDHANRTAADLDEFHQDLQLAHGGLACYACHNPRDADTLRLADSTAVQYSDVMTLCAQCHGPQARDYARGAHGGMIGYWDLSRGPRMRNNCVDCHDPHAPKFPRMLPTFKPRDRFLDPHAEH